MGKTLRVKVLQSKVFLFGVTLRDRKKLKIFNYESDNFNIGNNNFEFITKCFCSIQTGMGSEIQ